MSSTLMAEQKKVIIDSNYMDIINWLSNVIFYMQWIF